MTAWNIYLVMQADKVSAALNIFAAGVSVLCIISLVVWFMGIMPPTTEVNVQYAEQWRRVFWKTLFVSILLWIGYLAVPSTRTLAVMYVLPAVVNNEDVQSEARELYELAKEGLHQLVEQEDTE